MPSLSQRRVQDPVLTNIAQGYSNKKLIADFLFPQILVIKEEGKYVKFLKENLIAYSNADIAVGMGAQPIFIDFETSTGTYALQEYALGTKAYKREIEESDKKIELLKNKTLIVQDGMAIFIEKMIADMAQATANYTNSNTLDNSGVGKYKWSHASADPMANITTAVNAIRTATGEIADTCILGWASAQQLALVASIQQMININKGSGFTTQATPMAAVDLVKGFFGFKNVEIGMPQFTTSATGTLTDVWADNCIVAYVGKDTLARKTTQNFGCLLRKKGRPQMQKEIIPLSDETQAIMTRDIFEAKFINETCGYLIKDTV